MPFKPGQSGNPAGYKTKRQWIAEQERFEAAKKAWARLLRLADDLVVERKTVMGPDGPYEVDVTPSAKDYINCCKEILNRAVGLPVQSVEISGEDGEPFAFTVLLAATQTKNGKTDTRPDSFEFHLGGSDGKS